VGREAGSLAFSPEITFVTGAGEFCHVSESR
jgi:hypothetical protein